MSSAAQALDPARTLSQSRQSIWQVQQGLPQSTIRALLQTTDGYLWLGTQSGLFRFDGVRFMAVRPAGIEPQEDLWVEDLCEDGNQALWIATDGQGLLRMDRAAPHTCRRIEGLPDDVRSVIVDRQGQAWAATAAGLARVGPTTRLFDRAAGLATDNLRAVCEASDGTIWAGGSGNQLTALREERLGITTLTALSPHDNVQALLGTPDGALWIGTSAGLVRLDSSGERRYTTADGLASDDVLCLISGQNGELWIGTKEGFSRLLPSGELESFGSHDGLSQSTVYALCEDHEGSLWVGTKHGLNQFVDRRTSVYSTKEGLPSNDTGPVLQDSAGNIWVGTLGAGLSRFDGRRFTTLTIADGLAGDTIITLAAGADEALWVGTDQGLNLLRGGRVEKTFRVAEGLPADKLRCLFLDANHTLWAGTSAGLALLDGDRFERPTGDAELLAAPISALVEREPGVLVAAADDGRLLRCVDRQLELLPVSVGHVAVETFHVDKSDVLWVGTFGDGLERIDGKRSFRFTTRNGLYDDDIFAIVPDDHDRWWLACSKGIFFVQHDDLEKVAAGRVKRLTTSPFSPTDAQRTIECKGGIQPAASMMQDGRIWFSTTRGLLVVDPDHLQRSLPPIPVVVEEVNVNGKSATLDELAHLPPGETNLEFRYTALSFVWPPRLRFRYWLEGFDKDWVEAESRRQAFYTNLAPGSYRFHVAVRQLDGEYQELSEPLKLELLPYFYQRRWFLPLCGSLLLLTGWGLYRLRVRRIKEHLRLILSERSRIARELHDTLMQGFSGVTMEMQALSTRLEPSAERATLDDIIHDAGQCLREARRSVAGLRSPGTSEPGLAAAIGQAARQITETHDLRLKLRLEGSPRGLPPDVEYNLLRIAQEAVSNAVKHSGGRSVEVSLDCLPRELRLTIEDDGVGFHAGSAAGPQRGHYGVVGMRERASQIGAALVIDSDGAHGTAVRVVLPIDSSDAAVPSPPAETPAI